MMVLMLAVQLAWSSECPRQDIYAVGLNAYVLRLGEEELSLEMRLDEGRLSQREVVGVWRDTLQNCEKDSIQGSFEAFVQQTDKLYDLGLRFKNTPFWAVLERRRARLEIRDMERVVALSYVAFLRAMQKETGIAVRWNKEDHLLVEGMISTAGGSDLVADYVERVWD